MRYDNVLAGILLAAVAVVTAGCDHKELCFDHPDHALRFDTRFVARYNLQWELSDDGMPAWKDRWDAAAYGMEYAALLPGQPEGLRVNTYSAGSTATTSANIASGGGTVAMTPGMNSVLMYNNDTEAIVFDNLNASATAKASTRARSRAGYRGNPFYTPEDGNEITVTPPDPLFGHYIAEYDQTAGTEAPTVDVTMQPLVYTYYIRYEFSHGAQYLNIARGALAGMAQSVYLYDGHTGPEQATFLFDATVEEWGVQAVVHTFGVPDYPNPVYSRGEHNYGLNLEVRLRNGKVLDFNFDISSQMRHQPHGGVIVVKGLEISDKDGNADGSGFDVDVDDWGEFEDIIIQL